MSGKGAEIAKACATCRFWDWDSTGTDKSPDKDAIGWCHRYPPVAGDRASMPSFPRTFAEVWCGEHRLGTNNYPDRPGPTVDLDARLPYDPLGFRIVNGLEHHGITTYRQLIAQSPEFIVLIRNIGSASLQHVRTHLHSLGLRLADDQWSPDWPTHAWGEPTLRR